jgi:hypothetical protein
MKKLLCLLVLLLVGCATPQKRTEFICVADLNRDSICSIIPCSEVSSICKAGKYRILKNYVSGYAYAYIYSTEPLTDIKKCLMEASRRSVEETDKQMEGL